MEYGQAACSLREGNVEGADYEGRAAVTREADSEDDDFHRRGETEEVLDVFLEDPRLREDQSRRQNHLLQAVKVGQVLTVCVCVCVCVCVHVCDESTVDHEKKFSNRPSPFFLTHPRSSTRIWCCQW